MSTRKHYYSVYRYLGRNSAFARFSVSVLAMAAACAISYGSQIIALMRGMNETVKATSEEAPDIKKVIRSVHIDFEGIFKRFASMSSGETFIFVLLVVCLIVAVLGLLSIWYLRVRLYLFYASCPYIEGTEEYGHFVSKLATHVYTTEVISGGDLSDEKRTSENALIELKYSKFYIYYNCGHKKYIFDKRKFIFVPVDHIDSIDLLSLPSWRGLAQSCEKDEKGLPFERSVVLCADWFGENDYAIPACDFNAMLLDSFLNPFFLFQIFSTLIWIMDNYWYYSLMSVVSIVAIEVQMVNKRIRDYERINSMRIPPATIQVFRDMKWKAMLSNHIYPGDIFLLSHDGSDKPSVVPADCLILSGDVVVDESILTGESVPQFKSSLDVTSLRVKRNVISSKENEMRQSTVFAGTTLMLCRGTGGSFAGVKLQKPGAVCLVLRTGFESYQGRLVNAIIHSGDRVSASTTEGWCFLGILLVFALVSCSVVVRRMPTESLKKLILTTLHIITSVIPPEFPVILSMAVTLSILQLHKKGIYCTEPFRVPFAGNLDVCAFDKTGTLTEDQMKVVGIISEASISHTPDEKSQTSKSAPLPVTTALVIGGCHSLSRVSGSVVGDPMEKAAFEYMGWSLSSDSKSVESLQPWFFNNKGKLGISKITVMRLWQFLSELGRMSTIVSVRGDSTYWQKSFIDEFNTGTKLAELNNPLSLQQFATDTPVGNGYTALDKSFDGEIMLLCKGAPEHLRPLLKKVPEYYDRLYQTLAINGMRVLSLACKRLTVPANQVNIMERSVAESDLEFVGFLALESPIKPSSLSCMRQLEGHKLVMITGDNVLTACHVANTVEIGDRTVRVSSAEKRPKWGDFAILTPSEGSFRWRLRNGDALPHMTPAKDFLEDMYAIKDNMRLCLTGPTIDALLEYERDTGRKVIAEVVLHTTVFARVSPRQKEFVIRTFKKTGKKTSMCGDGTNDMAALKVSHVGISLLKSAVSKEHSQLTNKISGMIRKHVNDRQKEVLEQLKRDLQDDMPELKLGEASIASPFTYRRSDVLCVPLLVRNGRCTLTNVVLLYKVMGINALITSLGMSVLALDGVSLGDAQSTLYSLMYTVMLMALSKSKPAQVSNCKRPESSVFSPANFISLVGQCCLHIGMVLHMWNLGKAFRPETYVPNLDMPFEPNLVNTLVFYACFVINISGFCANYQGYPYMQPFRENRLMFRLTVGSVALILIMVCDVIPDLREYFSLVAIPNYNLLAEVLVLLALDVIAAVGIEHFCRRYIAS